MTDSAQESEESDESDELQASDDPLPELDAAERYRRLVAHNGSEALHELLVEEPDGLGILDNQVPYLVQRLRWREIDRSRRGRREISVDRDEVERQSSPADIDPAERIAGHVDLERALAALAPSDVALLWWSAAGYSGEEQSELWDRAGYAPASPSPDNLRQRIHRARIDLRRHLDPD